MRIYTREAICDGGERYKLDSEFCTQLQHPYVMVELTMKRLPESTRDVVQLHGVW